jgi:hypothetical protein
MKEYIVQTMDDLDDFEYGDAFWEYGNQYTVYVIDADEAFSPVYYFRENGDMDGLMGWK